MFTKSEIVQIGFGVIVILGSFYMVFSCKL